MDRAGEVVKQLLSAIGITVEFRSVTAGDAQAYPTQANHLKIVIVSDWPVHRSKRTLGVSPQSDDGSMRAYVFYRRVDELAGLLDADSADVLGLAIAHEMGHLLLPNRSHSMSGVMRQNIDRAQLHRMTNRQLGFSAEQGTLIRARIAALHSSSRRP